MTPLERMSALGALSVVHESRGPSDVVIATMSAARDWMTLPQHSLDFVYVPSAMGQATSLGLGISIAQPTRRVIVCNGDGSLLMNLGSLVSIAASGATNLVILLFDNGVYEVTGAQPTPGANRTDFAAIARGAGFTSVFEFGRLADWEVAAVETMRSAGPSFVWLRVDASGSPGPRSPGPAAARARQFRGALAAGHQPPLQ